MSSNEKPDEIKVYKSEDGTIRWTRRTTTNWKVVGASTEGYTRVNGALANIERTQREPYVVIFDGC